MLQFWRLRKIRRRCNALWVSVRFMEPFGDATFAVVIHTFPDGKDIELARGPSAHIALKRAVEALP